MPSTSSTNETENPVLTVTELNRSARLTIERHFNVTWVMGEMSNFARPRSGHWYFTLKDDKAQVRCAMFANRNRAVQMQPGDGQMVLLRGRVSLYEGRGDFQIIVDYMEPAGEGVLRQAFDQLKLRLSAEGLFDQALKQPLPESVRHVAVITSASGAALHDVLSVWRRRNPLLRVTLVPSSVQGDAAESALTQALQKADQLQVDAILLTRGGGSLEDLWTFNLESVARAVVACQTPVVSAVGHEIDTTIADFVADVRAPTPSAAAELLSTDQSTLVKTLAQYRQTLHDSMVRQLQHRRLRTENTMLKIPDPQRLLDNAAQRTDDAYQRLGLAMQYRLSRAQDKVRALGANLHARRPAAQLDALQDVVASLHGRLQKHMQHSLTDHRQRSAAASRMLHGLSPLPTLERGYSVVRDERGDVLTSVSQVRTGQALSAVLSDGTVHLTATHTSTRKLGDPE